METGTAVRLSILLVDNDPHVRANLPLCFVQDPLLEVVYAAKGGRAALKWLAGNTCDVVLSDTIMPDMGVSEFLRRVRRFDDPPVFVAMAPDDSDDTMFHLLAQGASGYIVKDHSPQFIVQAIHDALKSGMCLTPDCVKRVVSHSIVGNPSCSQDCLKVSVTDSEKEILRLLKRGETNKQIARAMSYAEVTVRKKISHLMIRFNARNRTDLALRTQFK